MAFYTLGNYITEVLAKLNEERNTNNYPDSLLINAINGARRKVWHGTTYNFSRKEYIRPGVVFDWQKDMAYFLSYDVRYLSADIGAIGADVHTDGDWLPSSGYVFMRDNLINYISNTGTILITGSPSTETFWKAGTPIFYAQALPADFAEPIAVYSGLDEKELYIRPRVDLHNKASEYYRLMVGGMGTTSYNPFTTMAMCSIEDWYFTGMYGAEGSPIAMKYRKSLTNITSDATTDTIPDGIDFIPDMAVASIYMDRGEEVRGQNMNDSIAVGRLLSFYKQQRQVGRETQFWKNIYYGDTANGSFNNPLFNVQR